MWAYLTIFSPSLFFLTLFIQYRFHPESSFSSSIDVKCRGWETAITKEREGPISSPVKKYRKFSSSGAFTSIRYQHFSDQSSKVHSVFFYVTQSFLLNRYKPLFADKCQFFGFTDWCILHWENRCLAKYDWAKNRWKLLFAYRNRRKSWTFGRCLLIRIFEWGR